MFQSDVNRTGFRQQNIRGCLNNFFESDTDSDEAEADSDEAEADSDLASQQVVSSKGVKRRGTEEIIKKKIEKKQNVDLSSMPGDI